MAKVKLYVGGIPYYFGKSNLSRHLKSRGYDPLEIEIAEDNGRPRGFAFVTLDVKSEVELVRIAFQGKKYLGYYTELIEYEEFMSDSVKEQLGLTAMQQPWKTQAFVKLTAEEIAYLISKLGAEEQDNLPKSEGKGLLEKIQDAEDLLALKTQPTAFDRLDELDLGQATAADNILLQGLSHFSYSWDEQNGTGAGYEKLKSKNTPNERGLSGGHDYSGVYHPAVICETHHGGTEGVCKHCGRTLF